MRVLRLGNKSYRKKPEIKDTGDRYTKDDAEKRARDLIEYFTGKDVYRYISLSDPMYAVIPDNCFPNIVGTSGTTDIRSTNTYYWSPRSQTNIKEDK